MEFTIKNGSPEKLRTDLLVVGIFSDGSLPILSEAVGKTIKERLVSLVKKGDLGEKVGSTVMLYGVTEAIERVLVVNLGDRDEFDEKAFRDVLLATSKQLVDSAAKEAVITLSDVNCADRSTAWRLQQTTCLLANGAYRYAAPKIKEKNERKEKGIRKVVLLISTQVSAELEAAACRGQAIAEGMALAKDLGNLPGNVCTPTYLAEVARTLGKQFKFNVDVFELADMEKLGMGALLSVARGSRQPPKLIVLNYKGGKNKTKPIVLVGKGITFDSGGISLKPGAEMDEMRFDMCGAASVIGTFKAVARMGLPVNLVGIIPACENMPDGNASKPGDVVKSMSGQSIEILNTDAEGRLILCDALTYAERFKPECVIDIATLTGACVIALGKVASGLLANDENFATELIQCGKDAGDRVWQLPLWDEYQDLLKSNFADMANIGGRTAGTITAACFLSRFAKNYKWAHFDIAGTAWLSGEAKGATGRPIPLLSEFLINRAVGNQEKEA